MAVAFDTFTVAAGHTDTPVSGVIESWSHTLTGSDLVLLVGAWLGIQGGSGNTPANDTATLTCAVQGVGAMADSGAGEIHADGSDGGFVQLFWIAMGGTTGAVTIDLSCADYAGGNLFFTSAAIAMSFTGAHQTTPLRGVDGTTGNSASATNQVSAGATSEMCFDIVGGGSNLAAHSHTNRWVNNESTASKCGCGGMATAAGSASAVTMTRTLSSDAWASISGAVQASGGAAPSAYPYRRRPSGLLLR